MLCVICRADERLAMGGQLAQAGAAREHAPHTCVRCGRAIDADGGERLVAKLAQLARFGLAGHPLLARRRP